MEIEMEEKKTNKPKEVQRKRLAVMVSKEEYKEIIQHMEKVGFTSVEAYLKTLIHLDMTSMTEVKYDDCHP